MAANPNIPPQAITPTLPPLLQRPIVDPEGRATIPFISFLQSLYALIQGKGGLIEANDIAIALSASPMPHGPAIDQLLPFLLMTQIPSVTPEVLSILPQFESVSFNALAGQTYWIHSAAGAITATLPASPSYGDIITLKDVDGMAGTNTITIAGNGNNIEGASTVTIPVNYSWITLQFTGVQWVQMP